jgi:aldose 1-epimerase
MEKIISERWNGTLELFSAKLTTKEGYKVIELRERESNSIAEVIPEIGNNLFRFESFGKSVILSPVSLEALKNETFADFKYGTPILYPPNRIKNGSFEFRGRSYQLPLNEPPSNHLHGEICSKAWEILEYGTSSEKGAYVTSTFRFSEHPEILSYFPHKLVFTVTYSLRNGQLQMTVKILNEGEDEAPFAFGLHPYFNIPFEPEEKVVLTVPSANEWPVTNEAFVTGLPAITAFSNVLTSGADISDYPPLGCSLLTLTNDDHVCRIDLMNRGYSIMYKFDEKFPFVILFRPDWASAISLEPYTYVTDAFNLPYEDDLTGVLGLPAGEAKVFQTQLWIEKKTL